MRSHLNRVTKDIFNSSFFLIAIAFVVIYFQFITPTIYTKIFGVFDTTKIQTFIFFVFYEFCTVFIIPLMVGLYIFKKTMREMGLYLPQNIFVAFIIIVISLCILIPVMFQLSKTTTYHHYYSIPHINAFQFIIYYFILMPVYYVAEEFFFRGFLFLLLWEKIRWHSLWITEIIFAFAHLFKPGLEILFAFPVGLFLNYVTLKSKSIYPSVVIHYALGFANILFVNYI